MDASRPSLAAILALAASLILVVTGSAMVLLFLYSFAMLAVSVVLIVIGAALLWWGMKRLHTQQEAANQSGPEQA
ncbi:MAG: hypothetical protein Q7P63_15955 [Verrucomicrobiota bacterium JB022]|nr:hypothetical protein [Verrucomicrobiota bacterium JB022]